VIKDVGYYPGGGMMSPDQDIFYLNIPKNASTYLTNILKNNSWTHWNILSNSETVKTTIAFVRDPVDRWISGFATYAALHLFGPGYGSDHFLEDFNGLTEKIIFDQIIFDDHTDFQVNYIQQIANYTPVYFRYNNKIIEQINSFLGYDLNTTVSVDKNSSDANYDTKQVSNFMRDLLTVNPDLQSRLVLAYRKDYEFINSIEFYNGPRTAGLG
jgi:hypothetical protein